MAIIISSVGCAEAVSKLPLLPLQTRHHIMFLAISKMQTALKAVPTAQEGHRLAKSGSHCGKTNKQTIGAS